jgi:hypothetical protein
LLAIAVACVTCLQPLAALAAPAVAQPGPRPFFLVNDMADSPQKQELQAFTNRAVCTRRDFSIGHRGATMQFPEHTKESNEAGARTGAGIVECEVTFTKDKELFCRHVSNDVHTTTSILATPLAHKESIELLKLLGLKMTRRLNNPGVTMPFDGFTREACALKVMDVLAAQVGVIGIFTDWPATESLHAGCTGLREAESGAGSAPAGEIAFGPSSGGRVLAGPAATNSVRPLQDRRPELVVFGLRDGAGGQRRLQVGQFLALGNRRRARHGDLLVRTAGRHRHQQHGNGRDRKLLLQLHGALPVTRPI